MGLKKGTDDISMNRGNVVCPLFVTMNIYENRNTSRSMLRGYRFRGGAGSLGGRLGN
jgi:hypothetical protein